MTNEYRMYVELPNGAKFRAQGAVEAVRVDLERFYALLNAPLTTAPESDGATSTTPGTNNGDVSVPVEQVATTAAQEGLDRTVLNRLFKQDRNGTVSLLALPHGENAQADAMLALIYGAGRLANEHQVTGSRLMKAAVQSGLKGVERIDRTLSSAIGPFVTAAGVRKGRRYGLTNPGIRRAEDVLKRILG